MIFLEASYSAFESLDGLGLPRPPCKSGSESEDLFVQIIDGRFPVIDGRRHSLMASSNGLSMSDTMGIVLVRKDHF